MTMPSPEKGDVSAPTACTPQVGPLAVGAGLAWARTGAISFIRITGATLRISFFCARLAA